MSSHHIVREKQEPALLILDLEGFHTENLGQLLEWSPTVIVAEDTYEEADSLGIKIDYIAGTPDKHLLQPRTRVIISEESILTAAMDYLAEEKYPSVNIVTSKPDIINYLPYCESMNIVILSKTQRIFMVRPGFSKWKPAGEKIQVLTAATQLTHKGLHQTSANTFKTNADGFYSLDFKEAFAFIAEDI